VCISGSEDSDILHLARKKSEWLAASCNKKSPQIGGFFCVRSGVGVLELHVEGKGTGVCSRHGRHLQDAVAVSHFEDHLVAHG